MTGAAETSSPSGPVPRELRCAPSDSDAIISVRGEPLFEVDPRIVRLSLTVAAHDADRAKAMHLLEERALQVDQILGPHAAAMLFLSNTNSTMSWKVCD